jgi:hypothetical protein
MEMFDQVLIDRVFSPLAGWLHHRFGVSQWRLSLECLNGNVAFYLVGIALSIAGKGMNDGIFIDLLRGAGWLLIVDFARRVALRQAASSIGVQSARMGEWLIRIVLIAAVPLSLLTVRGVTSLCFTISLLFLVLHLYFKASDTPPPEPRRKLIPAHSRA